MHAAWPIAAPRFFIVLLPLVLLLAWEGLRGMLTTSSRQGCALAACGLILSCYAAQDAFALHQARHKPLENRLPARSLAWVSRSTAADARFWTLLASPMLTLHTGRAAVSFVPSLDPEALRYRLHQMRVEFVFHEPLRASFDPLAVKPGVAAAWDAFPDMARRHPEAFRLVHAEVWESVQIFAVVPDAAFDEAYALTLEARRDLEGSGWDAGFAELERALKLYPGSTVAVNTYAAASMVTGKHLDRARMLLREALRLRPDLVEARANLERLETRRREQRPGR